LLFKIYFDDSIGMTHIEKHGVGPGEIDEFFTEIRYFEQSRKDNSFTAIGKLESGRFLQVVYRKIDPETLFIITAFDLQDPDMIAFLKSIED